MNILKTLKNLFVKEAYKCHYCGRVFTSNKGLLIHMRHKKNNDCPLHRKRKINGYDN